MSKIEELEQQIKELEKQTKELQNELEMEKQKTEIEYPPLNLHENYWIITGRGDICASWWGNDSIDQIRCEIGNIFLTEEKAEKERERRILLTRFRQFRDKCNGDWKPEWTNNQKRKYFIAYLSEARSHEAVCCFRQNGFCPFGFFKNKEDCKRAIELFGDEIKRLFVEG